MAVHEPTAGVVGLECDDDVCIGVGHDYISSGRIIAVKIWVNGTCTIDRAWGEARGRLVDDGKIVAVEMNLVIGERLRALEWTLWG